MQALKHATIFISLLGNFVFYMDVDCKNFEIAQTKRSPHKILWRIAFHPYYRQNEVPPAGVQGQKPRCFFIGQERSAKVKQYVFT